MLQAYTRNFWVAFSCIFFSFLYFGDAFNKAIIPLAVVGYEMTIAKSALCASSAIIISFIV